MTFEKEMEGGTKRMKKETVICVNLKHLFSSFSFFCGATIFFLYVLRVLVCVLVCARRKEKLIHAFIIQEISQPNSAFRYHHYARLINVITAIGVLGRRAKEFCSATLVSLCSVELLIENVIQTVCVCVCMYL
jgi:hypothetical protein